MRRREFITLLGGAAVAWPRLAWAQQPDQIRHIGVLIGVADDAAGQARLGAFRKGMEELRWVDGGNVRLDVRFTAGSADRARTYAAELIGLAPDLILANTSPVVAALQQQTRTIPIVFAQTVDPVNSGFVESLARPGGNITGFISYDFGMAAKWLEVLKELAPQITRVGVLRDPTVVGSSGGLGAIQAVVPSFGVQLKALDVRDAAAIEHGINAFSREPNSGLIVLPAPLASVHLDLIVALAERYRLPAIYPYRYFTKSGGLISYGIDNLDLWRRAAGYADRILKGEKPADLPVQAPTKYELVINLKAAKALNLTVPPTLLARADEVVE